MTALLWLRENVIIRNYAEIVSSQVSGYLKSIQEQSKCGINVEN